MSTRNIFITGATGKIGQALVQKLSNYNELSLSILDNCGPSRVDGKGLVYVHGDLERPESYGVSLKGVDTVVHMAAITHTNLTARYYAVNAQGTLNLAEASRRHGVKRFIFVSTRAISENGGDYSRSKLLAEKYVKESGMDWVILRLAEVYGMAADKGIDMLLNCIRRSHFIPVLGTGEYKMCPVHVGDAVFSIEQAIKKTDISNRTYTIAGPESYTYDELIDMILIAKGLNKIKIHIPIKLVALAAKMSAKIFKDRFMAMDQLARLISVKDDDISQARLDLSFDPCRLRDILKTAPELV